jgi:hypothetical protein
MTLPPESCERLSALLGAPYLTRIDVSANPACGKHLELPVFSRHVAFLPSCQVDTRLATQVTPDFAARSLT